MPPARVHALAALAEQTSLSKMETVEQAYVLVRCVGPWRPHFAGIIDTVFDKTHARYEPALNMISVTPELFISYLCIMYFCFGAIGIENPGGEG